MKLPVTPAAVSVVAMYAAFTVVGWLASRKARNGTAADLIVAGRRMPLWIAALTMTATWVDGGYLLGTAEAAYKSSIQLAIQGGLWPPPAGGARGVAQDPAQAGVAIQQAGAGSGGNVPEFRVSKIRIVPGACE